MDAPGFTVTLHHLSPDAKQAGIEFPDLEIPAVPEKKLRDLIRSLAALASKNLGAAAPELRISAPQGRYIVRIAEGQLRITSWDIRVGGTSFSADQVFGLITGADAAAEESAEVGSPLSAKRSSRGLLALLAVLVLGTNVFTAWWMTRPPEPPFLPEFTPLQPEQAERLMADAAGDYRTGTAEGDRTLTITRDAKVRWAKFGPKQTMVESADLKVRAVQSRGQRALLADEQALITVADPATLIFYNETYRRVAH
jgi:hypothetical protein